MLSEIQEVHSKLSRILFTIDDICRSNDIKYYLFAGTLIGALRHHGFIPWDDDADIIMTRKNWEKFRDTVQNNMPEGFSLNSQEFDPTLAMPINHFVDANTTTIYRTHLVCPEVAGIPIDIIVLDAVPNDGEAWKQYVDDVQELQDFTNPVYYYGSRKLLHPGTSTNVKQNEKLAKEKGRRYVLDKIMERLTQYDEDECDFLVQRFGGAPIVYPKDLYGEPRYVPFEDGFLPIPQYAEEVLFIAYGDWMNIPRSGSTLSSHEYSLRSFSISPNVYLDYFRDKVYGEDVLKPYMNRHCVYDSNASRVFNSGVNTDAILVAKVEYDYAKKLNDINLKELFNDKEYDKLLEFFDEYLTAQCGEALSGSPSVMGWKRWYRRNCPCPIDIGDEALAILILTLLKHADMSRAHTILRARLEIDREFSPELKKAYEIFDATRTAIKHFYCEEYDICEKIIGDYLPAFPDNCMLWLMNFKLSILNNKITDVYSEIEIGLSLFPNNVQLLGMKSEYLVENGRQDEAYDILKYLVSCTDNGLVLDSLKNKLFDVIEKGTDDSLKLYYLRCKERLCEELSIEEQKYLDDLNTENNSIAETNEEEHATEISGPLAVRLKLLQEIDKICRENNIGYVLWGELLLQIVARGNCIDKNTDFVIAMKPKDADAFLHYCQNHKTPNRHIECMRTNSQCSEFGIYYCDTETLDFDFSLMAEREAFGINVKIVVLRAYNPSRIGKLYDKALEVGWKQQITKIRFTRNQKITYTYVNLLTKLIGKRNASKYVFNKLLKDGDVEGAKRLYQFAMEIKDGVVPSYLYDSKSQFKFFDEYYYIPKDYQSCVVSLFEGKVADALMPINEYSDTRIVDSNVKYSDFTDYLEECGIDYVSIGNYNNECSEYKVEISQYSKEIKTYWNKMLAVGRNIKKSEEQIGNLKKLEVLE